jgi:hypothetical protein
MSEDHVKRQLLTLRSLFTEQALLMSVVLDLGISVDHMRDPMVDGLQTIQEAIAETLQALQGAEHLSTMVDKHAVAAPVAAEPGPTNGAGRSAIRAALGRVLGAKKA